MNIEICNLNFSYFKLRKVINNISFSVNNGNTLAIVGASGCGKSTLLRLISGLINKNNNNFYTGTITIEGLVPKEYSKRCETGFMFQEPTLFPNLTVRQNVLLPLQIKHLKSEDEADKLIEMVGLNDYQKYLPSILSGGMKTRVSLARTFVTKPKLLLLDEPFSALDIRWRYNLYRELDKLKNEYKPLIIIVTHDIHEALLLSNHIIVFSKNGVILKEMIIDKPLPRVYNFDYIKN